MKLITWVQRIRPQTCTPFILLLLLLSLYPHSSAAQSISAQATTPSARFAPGDVVPLSVKLSNFGSNERVDVTVHYTVADPQGLSIFEASETVAVQTSASYIKNVTIPFGARSGVYTAKTTITYAGQLVPAVGTYQFTVEQTYFGLFLSELIWYVGGILLVLLLFLLIILLVLKRRREARYIPYDYSGVDENVRIYYELIGDAIQQMRYHEGERAIALAQAIPGLAVEQRTGRVVNLSGDPGEIMATLISQYNTRFGRNVNLALTKQAESRAIVR